jgi:hypothetical protein
VLNQINAGNYDFAIRELAAFGSVVLCSFPINAVMSSAGGGVNVFNKDPKGLYNSMPNSSCMQRPGATLLSFC